MGVPALRAWVETELLAANWPHDPATDLARTISDSLTAGAVVAAARATADDTASILSWLERDDFLSRWAKGALLEGNPDGLWAHVAEDVAPAAPDVWDPNWPDHKSARALVLDGSVAGDRYLVGAGEGRRALVEVQENQGQLLASISPIDGPLDGLLDQARAEAERLTQI